MEEVDGAHDAYEPTRAGRAIADFVNDNLSNWYVRLNRKRFWGGEMSDDKLSAYQTLYQCLVTVAQLMSPIAPFYADRLYLDLIAPGSKEMDQSVHLTDFPQADETLIGLASWRNRCTSGADGLLHCAGASPEGEHQGEAATL